MDQAMVALVVAEVVLAVTVVALVVPGEVALVVAELLLVVQVVPLEVVQVEAVEAAESVDMLGSLLGTGCSRAS